MEHAETIALLVALQVRMEEVSVRLAATLERLEMLLQRQKDDAQRNDH